VSICNNVANYIPLGHLKKIATESFVKKYPVSTTPSKITLSRKPLKDSE
jgi:hypothetical protein